MRFITSLLLISACSASWAQTFEPGTKTLSSTLGGLQLANTDTTKQSSYSADFNTGVLLSEQFEIGVGYHILGGTNNDIRTLGQGVRAIAVYHMPIAVNANLTFEVNGGYRIDQGDFIDRTDKLMVQGKVAYSHFLNRYVGLNMGYQYQLLQNIENQENESNSGLYYDVKVFF